MIKTFTASIASSLMTSLTWIAAANADYRQARRLQHLTDDHLADMGLTRHEAETLLDAPTARSTAPNRARSLQLRRS
jgi:uncharacterized protein YjiS (DUF1127 family)